MTPAPDNTTAEQERIDLPADLDAAITVLEDISFEYGETSGNSRSLYERVLSARRDLEAAIRGVRPAAPQIEGEPVTIPYTNWRGEHAERTIRPTGRVLFTSDELHHEPQWLIEAHDERSGEVRLFALKGIGAPPQIGQVEGLERLREQLNAFADEMSAGLQKPGWRPNRSYMEDARNLIRKASAALLANQSQPAAGISKAACDVLAERRRQIEAEGWTPEHDDGHSAGSMAVAAASYAFGASAQDMAETDIARQLWPWDVAWWKPSQPRRMLVKAGALILAEIERLDRAAPPAQGGSDRG